jgi:hypothetical protein
MRAGQQGPVAAAGGQERVGGGATGQAVEAAGDADDLEFAGEALCQLERDLVGLSPGVEEHRTVQSLRQRRHQLLRKLQDRLGEHFGIEMHERVEGPVEGLDDAWMPVAEGRADLTGGKVQDITPLRGSQPRAAC